MNIQNSALTITDTPINANIAEGIWVYNGYLYASNSMIDIDMTESISGYALRFQEITSGEDLSELRVYYSDISLQTPANNYSRVIEGGTLAEEGSSIYCAGESMDALQEMELPELMQCLNHVGRKELLEGQALKAADINGDGSVNLVDLMRLLNYVGRKTPTL